MKTWFCFRYTRSQNCTYLTKCARGLSLDEHMSWLCSLHLEYFPLQTRAESGEVSLEDTSEMFLWRAASMDSWEKCSDYRKHFPVMLLGDIPCSMLQVEHLIKCLHHCSNMMYSAAGVVQIQTKMPRKITHKKQKQIKKSNRRWHL